MPVYEYQCRGCSFEFEREQRITDKPFKKCPECGAMKAKRLISRTSFVLKGSGWYNDLYASPKPAGAKDDSATAQGASDKASDKGEAQAKPTDSAGKEKAGATTKKGASGTEGERAASRTSKGSG